MSPNESPFELATDGSVISGMRNVQIYLKSVGIDTGPIVGVLKLRAIWLPILFVIFFLLFVLLIFFRFFVLADPYEGLLEGEKLVLEDSSGVFIAMVFSAIVALGSSLLGFLGVCGYFCEQTVLLAIGNALSVRKWGRAIVRWVTERARCDWNRFRLIWNGLVVLIFLLFPLFVFSSLVWATSLTRLVVFEDGFRRYDLDGEVQEWGWDEMEFADVSCKGKSLFYALWSKEGERFLVTRENDLGEDVVRWVDQTVRSRGIPRNVDGSSIGYRCRNKWADVLER